jgi:hypothetical protein
LEQQVATLTEEKTRLLGQVPASPGGPADGKSG